MIRFKFENKELRSSFLPQRNGHLWVFSMQGIIPDILQRMKSASHSITSVRAYQGDEISVVSVPAIQGDEISIISARAYHGDETSVISAPGVPWRCGIVHLGTEVRHRSSRLDIGHLGTGVPRRLVISHLGMDISRRCDISHLGKGYRGD